MNFKYKKTIQCLLFAIISYSLILAPVQFAHAQTPAAPTNPDAIGSARDKLGKIGKITGFSNTEDLSKGDLGLYDKIASIVNILIGLAGIIATIFIIVAGLKWIMAGGNEEQIKSSKDTIKSSVIGIIVILAAFVLVNFVINNLIDVFT